MWALIEDGSITKLINNPKAMVIGDTRYSRNIFSFRWSNEEREAIGIYEVVWDNAKKKNEEWYTNTSVSYAFGNGKVTASYGDATAKAITDTLYTAEDESNGLGTEGEVKIEGLKTIKIRAIKAQAAGILQDTDWYITRKADAGTAVPSAITNHRAAVRTKCAEMETAITNAADTPAIETLYTYTKQEDNSVTRPLGELPRLES